MIEFNYYFAKNEVLTSQMFLFHRFKAVEGGPNVEQVLCWENTVIFIVTSFQYLIMACVYAKGWPFRQPFCSNCMYIIISHIFFDL